jgi:hypothetical protein
MKRILALLLLPFLAQAAQQAVSSKPIAAAEPSTDVELLQSAIDAAEKLRACEKTYLDNAEEAVEVPKNDYFAIEAIAPYLLKDLVGIILSYGRPRRHVSDFPTIDILIQQAMPAELVNQITTVHNQSCMARFPFNVRFKPEFSEGRHKSMSDLCTNSRFRLYGFTRSDGYSLQCHNDHCAKVVAPAHFTYTKWMNPADLHKSGCPSRQNATIYTTIPADPTELRAHLARSMYNYAHRNCTITLDDAYQYRCINYLPEHIWFAEHASDFAKTKLAQLTAPTAAASTAQPSSQSAAGTNS